MANLDGFGQTKRYYTDDNKIHKINRFYDGIILSTFIYNNESNLTKSIFYKNGIISDMTEYGNDNVTIRYQFDGDHIINTIYHDKNKCVIKYYSSGGLLNHISVCYKCGQGDYYLVEEEDYVNDILVKKEEVWIDDVEDWNKLIN
jgi:hypothetical protein